MNEKAIIKNSLLSWMKWCRNEQVMTQLMTVSYMPNVSDEYRKGRIEALKNAESILGLLMIEKGIDLRVCEKSLKHD